MAKRKRRSKYGAGVSRIDQPDKRTHGFFVRLTRHGKVHNAFFADKSYGGKQKALAAAQKHYQSLLKKHGFRSRRDLAQIPRRKSASGIVGVRRFSVPHGKTKVWYWMATWSPKRGVLQRRTFSVRKYGEARAKKLAMKARSQGLRTMED
jgi:hypothetical protein